MAGSTDASQYTQDELQQIIMDALRKQQSDHDAEMQGLRDQVESLRQSLSGTIPVTIPAHGAGSGTTMNPTWSQWEQENAWRDAELARA